VLGLARRLFDGIEAAGVRGVRIPDLSRSVGHRNTKLIDKYVTTLVNAGLCELRKVSDGKVHSYLLFTPEAIDVYDKMTTAATIATTMRVSVKSGGVKQGGSDADFGVSERESEDEQRKPDARKLLMPPPPRLAGRIRKVHPARDAGDAAPAAKKRAAKKHTGVSPPPEDDQPARVKHSHEVKPSSIHKVHSAERQRRAAHAVATVARHGGVVARAALLIAILRQCNSQQVASVDTKTCKRLLEQLLSDGKLAAAAVDYGEDTMDVISLPSVDLQSFETRAFVAQLAQLRGTSSFGTYLDDADRGVKPYIGNRRMYKRVGAIERLENNVGVITHPSGRQPRGQALKLLMGGRRGVSYSDHRKKRTRDERREAFVERYAEVSETYRIQFAALVNRIGGPRRSLSGSDSEESSEDDEDEVQTTQGLREDTASLESRRAATALLVRRLAQFGKPLDKLERMACALATQNSDDGDDDDSDSDASVASSSSDDASEGASDDDDAALECMPTITRFDSTSSFVKRDRDSSTNAERRSEQKRLKALATKPALPEPEAASVSGVKVAPLARQIARLVAAAIASGDADALEGVDRDWIGDAVERERAKGAVGTPPAPPPREAIDAALSRLLRRGWVAHVDAPIAARLAGAEPNLVVPVGAILDASNHEISRLFGGGTLGASGFFDALREAAQSDEAFSASAPRDQPAIDVDARLLPQGGHVAVLLARASRGALTIVADDWGEPAGLPVAKKRRGLPGPRPASDAAALWVDPDAVGHHRWGSWTSTKTLRGANDEALYAVAPANDADAARMWRDVLDSAAVWCDGAAAPRTAVRAAMRRVVFVHALLGVGKTPRAIVDDRARLRLTPEIDEVETLSMLLDLVDAGVFAIRGKPPNGDARRRNRKATIFNDDDDEDEDDDDAPRPVDLALAALTARDDRAAPRFFATHNALENFLQHVERRRTAP